MSLRICTMRLEKKERNTRWEPQGYRPYNKLGAYAGLIPLLTTPFDTCGIVGGTFILLGCPNPGGGGTGTPANPFMPPVTPVCCPFRTPKGFLEKLSLTPPLTEFDRGCPCSFCSVRVAHSTFSNSTKHIGPLAFVRKQRRL